MIFLFQEKVSQVQPSPRGIKFLPRLDFCRCPLLDGKVNQTGARSKEQVAGSKSGNPYGRDKPRPYGIVARFFREGFMPSRSPRFERNSVLVTHKLQCYTSANAVKIASL